MTDAERLSLIVDTLEGGNARRFSEKTGIDASIVCRMRSGQFGIGRRIEQILKAYPIVSREWLSTGVGYPGDLSSDIIIGHYKAIVSERDKIIKTLTKEIELQQSIIEKLTQR